MQGLQLALVILALWDGENRGKGNRISNSWVHKLNQAQMCNIALAQKDYQVNVISWYDLIPIDTIGRKGPFKHIVYIPW